MNLGMLHASANGVVCLDSAAAGLAGLAHSSAILLLAMAFTSALDRVCKNIPWRASLFVQPVLYFGLTTGLYIFAGAVDQPHPAYAVGGWLSRRVNESLSWGGLFAALMSVIVLLDAKGQCTSCDSREKDGRYYPRFRGVLRSFSVPRARVVLLIGLSSLFGYYALTAIRLYEIGSYPGGIDWPPERVFFVCMVGWGILWVADCMSRPRPTTLLAAIGFLLCSWFFISPFAWSVLRE